MRRLQISVQSAEETENGTATKSEFGKVDGKIKSLAPFALRTSAQAILIVLQPTLHFIQQSKTSLLSTQGSWDQNGACEKRFSGQHAGQNLMSLCGKFQPASMHSQYASTSRGKLARYANSANSCLREFLLHDEWRCPVTPGKLASPSIQKQRSKDYYLLKN